LLYHYDHRRDKGQEYIGFWVSEEDYKRFNSLGIKNKSEFFRFIIKALSQKDFPTIKKLNELLGTRIDELSPFTDKPNARPWPNPTIPHKNMDKEGELGYKDIERVLSLD